MESTNAEQASTEAVHKAKNAAQAVEMARQAQQAELVEQTAQKTKEALLSALKEVFTNDNDRSPQDMKVLIQRVPILCTTMIQMHEDIKDLKGTQMWAMRTIIGAVLMAVLKLVLLP